LDCTTTVGDLPDITPDQPTAISITDACQNVDNSLITYSDVLYGTAQACDRGTIRTFFAQDGCGNFADTVSVTFQLIDITAPVFVSFPSSVTVNCADFIDDQDPFTNPELGFPSATDNCEPVFGVAPTITYSDAFFSTVGICPTSVIVTRTWIATDTCHFTTERDQLIFLSVEDPPTVIAPPDVTFPCTSNSASTAPIFTGTATVESDCLDPSRIPITYFDENIFNDGCTIVYLRTFVAIDPCDNTNSDTQEITLVDEEDPSFAFFPPDYVSDCHTGDIDPRVSGFPIAVDDCTYPVCLLTWSDFTTYTETVQGCPGNILIYRTWTATDNCDNSFSEVQILTIGVTPDGGNCPPDLCPPEGCELCECPITECDCCSAGGITACTPVPCSPVACSAVSCTAVDCTPCAINLDGASGPAPLCGPEIACIPNIVPIFVDDGDGLVDTTYPYGGVSLSDRVDYWVDRADYWRDLLINGGIDFSGPASLRVTALALLLALPLALFGMFS